MSIGRAGPRIALITGVIVALALAGPGPLRAGGVNFGDDDNGGGADEGPSFFGFVRDAGGSAVPTPR